MALQYQRRVTNLPRRPLGLACDCEQSGRPSSDWIDLLMQKDKQTHALTRQKT